MGSQESKFNYHLNYYLENVNAHKWFSLFKDEFLYHEMLVHPSLLLHPNPKVVFIGGGGEGGTAREILKHKSVEKVIMVDIDGDCVEFCKKHMPSLNKGVYEDKRMELVIDDAKAYLENYKKKDIDVMIMDLADPQDGGPCYQLYTQEFYQMCKSKLRDKNSILCTQATGCDLFNAHLVFTCVINTLSKVFKNVAPYKSFVPSFLSQWGFVMVHDEDLKYGDIDKLIEARITGGEKALQIYDAETHQSNFSMDKMIRKKIAEEKRIIKKDNYVFLT